MIRRQPTLIALNENDVQDVRDLLERIKAAKEELRRTQEQTLAAHSQPSTSGSTVPPSTSSSNLGSTAGVNTAVRTKEERLGLR